MVYVYFIKSPKKGVIIYKNPNIYQMMELFMSLEIIILNYISYISMR
jgi:hypothetical protein